MMLISTYMNEGKTATVSKDIEQSTYVVKLLEDDKEILTKTIKTLGIAEDFCEDWVLGEISHV